MKLTVISVAFLFGAITVSAQDEDPILRGGTYVEALVGYGQYGHVYEDYTNYYSEGLYQIETQESFSELVISIRTGTKWYFGQREKWRPGILLNWLRLDNYIDIGNTKTILRGKKTISFTNVGMTNVFKFNNHLGMEANFSTGPVFVPGFNTGSPDIGLQVGPEVKLRFSKFVVGIDYIHIFGNTSSAYDFNVFALSIGADF